MSRLGGDLIVMGIDPSLTSTGYAFVQLNKNHFRAIDYGTIKTKSNQKLSDRLALIYHSLSDLCKKNKPNEIAIEDVFYAKNPKIALMMGHARGASLVAIANQQIPVTSYSAREIKMAVSGYGNASKEQIRRMVLATVPLDSLTIDYDMADAFAVAICHCHRMNR